MRVRASGEVEHPVWFIDVNNWSKVVSLAAHVLRIADFHLIVGRRIKA
jgi:hypothetical protein